MNSIWQSWIENDSKALGREFSQLLLEHQDFEASQDAEEQTLREQVDSCLLSSMKHLNRMRNQPLTSMEVGTESRDQIIFAQTQVQQFRAHCEKVAAECENEFYEILPTVQQLANTIATMSSTSSSSAAAAAMPRPHSTPLLKGADSKTAAAESESETVTEIVTDIILRIEVWKHEQLAAIAEWERAQLEEAAEQWRAWCVEASFTSPPLPPLSATGHFSPAMHDRFLTCCSAYDWQSSPKARTQLLQRLMQVLGASASTSDNNNDSDNDSDNESESERISPLQVLEHFCWWRQRLLYLQHCRTIREAARRRRTVVEEQCKQEKAEAEQQEKAEAAQQAAQQQWQDHVHRWRQMHAESQEQRALRMEAEDAKAAQQAVLVARKDAVKTTLEQELRAKEAAALEQWRQANEREKQAVLVEQEAIRQKEEALHRKALLQAGVRVKARRQLLRERELEAAQRAAVKAEAAEQREQRRQEHLAELRPVVEADQNRVLKPTASRQEAMQQEKWRVPAGAFKPVHGYRDHVISKDKRLRVEQALRSCGLIHSSYGRDILAQVSRTQEKQWLRTNRAHPLA
jgi:hypothetical protein